MNTKLTRSDALLIVDMQKDFCPGGALPVQLGPQVIATLNKWIAAAEKAGSLIVFSRDWHPPNHVSFAARGGTWPEHCIRDTEGAAFHPDLTLPSQAVIVSKGKALDTDQYSAFGTNELRPLLEQHNVSRVWVGGVALDVCVKATVLDALNSGFEVHLIEAGTAPVNEDDGRQALEEMQSAGAILE